MMFAETIPMATLVFTPKAPVRERLDIVSKLHNVEGITIEKWGNNTYKIYRVQNPENSLAKS